MPYTRQTAFGWSHQLNSSTVFSADFVRNDGRDLNVRPRINTRPVGQPTAPRRLAFLDLQPNAVGTRPAVSRGKSEYTALIMGIRRRMSSGLRFLGQLHAGGGQEHDRHGGRRAQFEQYAGSRAALRRPRVFGPTSRTDARIAFRSRRSGRGGGASASRRSSSFRSALPVSIYGRPRSQRRRRRTTTCPRRPMHFDGDRQRRRRRSASARPWNCGRGASRWQMNLRVVEVVPLVGSMRGSKRSARSSTCSTRTTRPPSRPLALLGTGASRTRTSCSQAEFSGDFQNPEQRVGQLGFRFMF